jgi:transcriptional regulator with XRE-family HTH domain
MTTITKDPISRYTEETFYEPFYADLWDAVSHVIICSPFIRPYRLDLVLPQLIALLERGVQVCVFLQDPAYNQNTTEEMHSQSPEEFKFLVDKLYNAGVHVVTRPYIHQKIALIDGKIVYEGSLNILSFSGYTEENMLRDERATSADWMQNRHRLFCPQCKSQKEDALDPVEWFGQQFKKCRDAAKLSQLALADLMGIDSGNISQIEHGKRNLYLDAVLEYAGFMCFDIAFVPKSAVPLYNSKVIVKDDGRIMTRTEVCQLLETHRANAKVSKFALAKHAKMSRSQLDKILKKNENTTVESLMNLAAGLGLVMVLLPFTIYTLPSPRVGESGVILP